MLWSALPLRIHWSSSSWCGRSKSNKFLFELSFERKSERCWCCNHLYNQKLTLFAFLVTDIEMDEVALQQSVPDPPRLEELLDSQEQDMNVDLEQQANKNVPPQEQQVNQNVPPQEQQVNENVPPQEQHVNENVPPQEQQVNENVPPQEQQVNENVPPQEQQVNENVPPQEQQVNENVPPQEQQVNENVPPQEQDSDTEDTHSSLLQGCTV